MQSKLYLYKSLLICMCMLSSSGTTIEKPCVVQYIVNKCVTYAWDNTDCDAITREKPVPGTYVAYTSSKAGVRFKRTFGAFIKSNITSAFSLLLYPDIKYQTIKMFGATTTNSSAVNYFGLKSARLQQHLIEPDFSDVNLQYNFRGVPIGSNDFSTFEYDLVKDNAFFKNYSVSHEEYKVSEEHPSVVHILGDIGTRDYDDVFLPSELLISDGHPGNFLGETETYEGADLLQEPKVDLESWKRTTSCITRMITDLNSNMADGLNLNDCLSEETAKKWNGSNVDTPIVSPMGELYKQPLFFAIEHICKFVLPGSRRIHAVDVKVETNIERPILLKRTRPKEVAYVAFLTPADTIIVVINNSGPGTEVQIQVGDKQATVNVEANAIVTVQLPHEMQY